MIRASFSKKPRNQTRAQTLVLEQNRPAARGDPRSPGGERTGRVRGALKETKETRAMVPGGSLGGGAFRVLWLAAGAGALATVAAFLVQSSLGQPGGGLRPMDGNAATRPADANAATRPALVTQEQFLKVMKQSCVRCHQQCASVEALKKAKWLVPGKPDESPVFKVIGVHRNRNGTYHNLSPADKQIVHDFIEQMK
jgi:mono/diheme cytochrome c family protein